ncbi:hypothetical protein M231_08108, partial [Tremella mesenterica]
NKNLAFELAKQLWSSRPSPESSIRMTRVTAEQTQEGIWTCTVHGKQGDESVKLRLPISVLGGLWGISEIRTNYEALQQVFFQQSHTSGDIEVYKTVSGGKKQMDFEGTYRSFLTVLDDLPLGTVQKALEEVVRSVTNEEADKSSGEDDKGKENSDDEGRGQDNFVGDNSVEDDDNDPNNDNQDEEDNRDLGSGIVLTIWYDENGFHSESGDNLMSSDEKELIALRCISGVLPQEST